MARPHLAFIVEPAHGHINPILGIMAELVTRGFRVSCPVNEYFARRVAESGAEAVKYNPLTFKADFARVLGGRTDDTAPTPEEKWFEYEREERRVARAQLERCYSADRPELIIYDFRNLAGRDLALDWGIPKIEHAPILMPPELDLDIHDENLVIVSIPEFFQESVEAFNERFHFVGPCFTERGFLAPWAGGEVGEDQIVLASGSTGLAPPAEFFRILVKALAPLPCRVILSIGDELNPEELGVLPSNCMINRLSSHLDILPTSALFVGQGGPASTLEALYCGVPALIVPPGPVSDLPAFDLIARQVERLGVGARLPPSPQLTEQLSATAQQLLKDDATRERARDIQRRMRATPSAKLAADLIETYVTTGAPPAREPNLDQRGLVVACTRREG